MSRAFRHILVLELRYQIEPAGRSIRLISERLAWLGGRSAQHSREAFYHNQRRVLRDCRRRVASTLQGIA